MNISDLITEQIKLSAHISEVENQRYNTLKTLLTEIRDLLKTKEEM